MPLQTTTEKLSAGIAKNAESIAGFVRGCVSLANDMTSATLALCNDDLAGWLNAKPAADRKEQFTGHGLLGEALNAAAAVAEANLGLATGALGRVDVRSVPEKLAEQYRAMSFSEDGKFVIVNLPRPEPEVEEIQEGETTDSI